MKNIKTLALAVAIAVPCSFAVASPATSQVDKTVAKAQAGNVQAQVKLGFNYRDGTNGFPMVQTSLLTGLWKQQKPVMQKLKLN